MIVENHALWGEESTEDYPATFTYLGAEPLPDKPNGRRPAVIICGGGAFTHIAPHEQDPVAFAFLDHGYQAFVLNYVTSSTGDVSFPHPQADLAKMVATVRANADEWHVDPKRVCVVGFSAGGMICASLATQWKTGPFAALAGARPDDIRPDAVVLGYPVITSGEFRHDGSICNLCGDDAALRGTMSLENQVSDGLPPFYIWHTVEDAAVPVQNSMLLATALTAHKVPFELHLFAHDGHGTSTCTQEVNTPNRHNSAWVPLCTDWLADTLDFHL